MNFTKIDNLNTLGIALLLFFVCLPIEASTSGNSTAPVVSTRLTEDYPLEMPSLKKYPIYINASVDAPDEIDTVEVEINGTTYTAEAGTDLYYYLWTPDGYGDHTINITAKAMSGDETTITRTINVTSTVATQTVGSLQDVIIEFNGTNSRWFYGTYTFPQFVGVYSNINAFLEVECPAISGGCDDWDRWAHIDVKAPDGNWIQLIRYITPYGVGCNHEIDVSDYESLLQGEVEFRVFIDTWGTGGWQLTLNLEYQQGAPEYLYSNVVEVWDDAYNFGDPANLQPVQTFGATIPEGVMASHLRISNTGHAWGSNNTQNAAEFFHAIHYIDIDAVQTFTQDLWNTCNPNPDGCTGQQGSWTFPRAGWCPGAISPPDVYDLTPYIGSSLDLDYRFHPTYQDLCHPNNPNCISGTTCPDCNDGYNPVYFVDTHIINRSNIPLFYQDVLGAPAVDNVAIYDLKVYPNPSAGLFKISAKFPESLTRLTVHTVDGRMVKAYYFDSAEALSAYSFDLSALASGTYFLNLQNTYGTGTKRIILN